MRTLPTLILAASAGLIAAAAVEAFRPRTYLVTIEAPRAPVLASVEGLTAWPAPRFDPVLDALATDEDLDDAFAALDDAPAIVLTGPATVGDAAARGRAIERLTVATIGADGHRCVRETEAFATGANRPPRIETRQSGSCGAAAPPAATERAPEVRDRIESRPSGRQET